MENEYKENIIIYNIICQNIYVKIVIIIVKYLWI